MLNRFPKECKLIKSRNKPLQVLINSLCTFCPALDLEFDLLDMTPCRFGICGGESGPDLSSCLRSGYNRLDSGRNGTY